MIMNNKFLFLTILVLTNLFTVQAQITIGSEIPPKYGTLLDLKENNNSFNNSTKGIGMPRVKLTTPNSLSDVISGTIDKATSDAHIGLVVYAVQEFGTPKRCPGLYVWNGTQWDRMSADGLTRETADRLYDREGNEYTISSFGTAGTWMTQNLRSTVEPCGQPIAFNGAYSTEKVYHYPQTDGTVVAAKPASWKPEYGLLYNWNAAINGKTIPNYDEGEGYGSPNPVPSNVEQVGVQGICPYGWHLPSDKEWNDLEKVISENPYPNYSTNNNPVPWNASWNYTTGFRGKEQGRSMKSKTQISTYNPVGLSNTNGTGFNVLLLGYVNNNVQINCGNYAFYWTSSWLNSNNSAWSRVLTYQYGTVQRTMTMRDRLFSVRCKKD